MFEPIASSRALLEVGKSRSEVERLRPLTKPWPQDAASFSRYDLAYAYIELCKTALQYGLYDHDMQRLTMIVAIRTGVSV